MLTKDEVKQILKSFQINAKNPFKGFYETLEATLEGFIEKPKREVQKGDFYKNKKKQVKEIVELHDRFLESHNDEYSYDGKSYHDDDELYNLDLSHRYKLFEVNDNDEIIGEIK